MAGMTLAGGRGLPVAGSQATFTAHVPLVVSPSAADLGLSLDEYQHVETVALILDELLATAARPLRLLEIRSSNQTSLAPFLDPLQITIATGRMRPDGRLELNAGDGEVFDAQGKAPEGTFDVVIALDLVEAIPAACRTDALRECLRISKHGVIGTAVNRVPVVCELVELDATRRPTTDGSIAEENESPPDVERASRMLLTPTELQSTLRAVCADIVELDCVSCETWLALRALDDALETQAVGPSLRQRVVQNLRTLGASGDGAPYRKVFVCGTSARAVAHLREHRLVSPVARACRDDADSAAEALRCATRLTGHTLAELQNEVNACHNQIQAQNAHLQSLQAEHVRFQNTWSWRCSAPLRWMEVRLSRLAERVVQLFWRVIWSIFMRHYSLRHMRPAGDLDGTPESGSWMSLGHDPQFVCPTWLISGWLRITLRMRSDTAGRVMLYHDDTGAGFTTNDVWTIGSLRPDHWLEFRKTIRHDKAIHALRFDPIDAPANLTIERFEVACIPGWLRVATALRSRIAAAQSRGVLGPMLRTGIGLLLRGDFAALRQKLSSPCGISPNSTPADQYQMWRELRQLRLSTPPNVEDGPVTGTDGPKLSLLLCPGSATAAAVRRSVESILRQTHSRWELCVAYDRSTLDPVRRWLAQPAAADRRIRIASEDSAASSAAALNRALSLADGGLVGRISPGDQLAAHAVESVIQACADFSAIDVVYADEDQVNEFGGRSEPFFKPNWSPEYLLASNYLGPFVLIRTSLVREVGGFRDEHADALDYDLALRCVARTSRVHHIADVLSHRGDGGGSVLRLSHSTTRAAVAERTALESHLRSTGQSATVEPGLAPNTHRVRRAIRGNPLVSIVIPSACGQGLINGEKTWFALKCVQSIRRLSTYPRVEILVVDNNDMPSDLERELRAYDIRRVTFVEPFNLSAKMNLGASQAQGEQLILLNDDIEVISPEWIESLLEFSQQEDIGAVGAKLLFPSGLLQHIGVTILDGNPGHPFYMSPGDCPGYFHSTQIHRNYVAVTGACVMTRASVFRELGGFDVKFPLNYNDVDYCLRVLESGRRNVFTPYAQLYHHESVSQTGTTLDELANFKRKWGEKYRVDPYYNLNLTLKRTDYALNTVDAA